MGSEQAMLMLLAELNQKVDRILRLLSHEQTPDQAPHHVLPEKAVCAELGANGLRLIGYRRISPGDYLDLSIQFPEELSPGVRLLGQVVYEITFPSEERHQAGIVFTATHREDREQIARYVSLSQRRVQESQ
jgi:hypothetical protein